MSEEEMELYLFEDEEGATEAQAELEHIIRKFADEVQTISEKYPDVGIGDAEVDNAIVQTIYNLIH